MMYSLACSNVNSCVTSSETTVKKLDLYRISYSCVTSNQLFSTEITI